MSIAERAMQLAKNPASLVAPSIVKRTMKKPATQSNSTTKTSESISVSVTIICMTQESFELLDTLQSNMNELMSSAFRLQLRKFFKNKIDYLFAPIVVEEQVQHNQRKFFAKPFVYQILPEEILLAFDESIIKHANVSTTVTIKLEQSPFKHDKKAVYRFISFLSWQVYQEAKKNQDQQRMQYGSKLLQPDIQPELFDKALNNYASKYIGVESMVESLRLQLRPLIKTGSKRPRGILFWGPPGTGKTTAVVGLCDALHLELVAQGVLASGDFNQGIVGDTERLINHIALRAKKIPWQLCVLAIDEIEALAPSRSVNSRSGEHLSVILSIITGGKDVPNLILMGCTNLREAMDAAFMRRLPIKIFVGKPNFDARGKWITKLLGPNYFPSNDNNSPSGFEYSYLKALTLNFSHDNMCQLLERIKLANLGEITNLCQFQQQLRQLVTDFCRSERVVLGRYHVPELLNNLPDIDDDNWKQLKDLFDFAKIANTTDGYSCTGRIFFEFNAPTAERLQVEQKLFIHMSKEQKVFHIKFQQAKTVTELQEIIDKAPLDLFPQQSINDYLNGLHVEIVDHQTFATNIEEIKQNVMGAGLQGPLLQVWNRMFERYKINMASIPTELNRIIPANQELLFKMRNLIHNHISGLFRTNVPEDQHKRIKCLKPGNLTVEESLRILMRFALSGSFDSFHFVDADFLYYKRAISDEAAIDAITEVIEESREYNKSLIVVDLDSIAGVTKEYQSLKDDLNSATEIKGGTPFTYRISRPAVLLMVFRKMISAASISVSNSSWMVALSDHHFVSSLFKDHVNWCATPSSTEERLQQKHKQEEKPCSLCGTDFAEIENNNNACGKHSGKAFFIQEAVKDAATDSWRPTKLYTRDEAEKLMLTNSRLLPKDVAWTCCTASGFYSVGEIRCKHQSRNAQ